MCCNCRTALAEGELEYNEKHKSTAVYVKFPLANVSESLKSSIGKFQLNTVLRNEYNTVAEIKIQRILNTIFLK